MEAAVKMMREKNVAHLAVTPSGLDRTLQGMVFLPDLLRSLASPHGFSMLPISTIMIPLEQLRERGQIIQKGQGKTLKDVEWMLEEGGAGKWPALVVIVNEESHVEAIFTQMDFTMALIALKK